CWLGLGVRLWTDSDAVPMDRLAVLGALWFAAAYLPNYFWYISPRHNYLPSLGALMIAFYLTSRLLARWRALRPAAAAAAFLLFGLSASATLAEGQGWKRASGLHSRFMAEAPALLPDGPDGIFLAGMPRTVLRAPAFSLTDEHLYLYAYATGRLLRAGDVTITPARFGVFYRNQPSVYGPANLYWHPYKGLAVLSGGAGGSGEFTRPQRLRIEPPDLPAEDITLCGLAVCRGALAIPARVWLLSAKLRGAAAPKAPLFEAANGVSLAALSAARDPRWVEVEFVWKADRRPAADFATVIRLHDAAGALIFEPVYRSLTEPGLRSDKGLAVLWPAFNDLLPASTWKAGSAVAERFRLTLPKPLPAGPLEARLTLFEKVEGGPWKNLGEFKAALP
ncbi:MAG: hypothetical protein HZB91_12445, partial [Elusimicrobia bacterium]|nr:hypothetical protein [Elusimicrobiota bacterium]